MNQSPPSPAATRLLANARSAAETFRTEQTLRADHPLAVGNMVILPHLGSTGDVAMSVEWTLAARNEDRVLLVPTDHAPQNGDGDLRATATTRGQATAPLWLRPRWSRWLPATTLDGARWSGTLPLPAVREAHARAERALAGGARPVPGPGTPGYRAWIESVILPAWEALGPADRSAAICATTETSERTLGDVATLPPPAPLTRQRLMPLAAMLFLALSGALLAWGLFERDRAHRAEQRLAQREPGASVDPNAAYAFLHPTDSLRGDDPEMIYVGDGSVVLLVALVPPHAEPKPVDLVLQRIGSDEPVWTGEGLISSHREIRVAIATDLLPVGRYRLLVEVERGRDPDHTELEYTFVVTTEG